MEYGYIEIPEDYWVYSHDVAWVNEDQIGQNRQ